MTSPSPFTADSDCEIGGDSCPAWSAWFWGRIEWVQAKYADDLAQFDEGDDCMDAEDELLMEADLRGEAISFDLLPCNRVTCPRYAPFSP